MMLGSGDFFLLLAYVVAYAFLTLFREVACELIEEYQACEKADYTVRSSYCLFLFLFLITSDPFWCLNRIIENRKI